MGSLRKRGIGGEGNGGGRVCGYGGRLWGGLGRVFRWGVWWRCVGCGAGWWWWGGIRGVWIRS